MKIKDADKIAFLDFSVSLKALFDPAVDEFAEWFTATQMSSQAMRHLLPKCSSSLAGHEKARGEFSIAWPHVSCFLCDCIGPGPYMAPPVLAQARVPSHAWHLGRLCLRVNHQCVRAVTPWKDPHLFQSSLEQCLHINSLEMLTNKETPPTGTVQFALTEGSPHAGHTEPGSGHAVLGQWRNSSPQKTTLTAQYISQRKRMLWPTNVPALACTQVCLPSNCPAPSGYQTGQGSRVFSPLGGLTMKESDVVP
ncbi:Isoleucine--tRNA ligase [Labeo rohita]|uniref:Isoleucine--tRNA ligase n=1 Tax=Labeo rohita TaxID=84645 RepID=A0ABQ8LYR4_LABRO|nr:Isoleucine--tRNA ligase [Labeo rohita]